MKAISTIIHAVFILDFSQRAHYMRIHARRLGGHFRSDRAIFDARRHILLIGYAVEGYGSWMLVYV